MKLRTILLGVFALTIAVIGRYVSAVTVNPASMVTADSDNTGLTIVYRDSNGDFSAGTITATTFTGTASAVADGSVTTAKIGANAVTTAKLLFNELPDSAALCVTTAKLVGYCSNAVGASGTCNCN